MLEPYVHSPALSRTVTERLPTKAGRVITAADAEPARRIVNPLLALRSSIEKR
jgi:hypothetical protein